MDRGNQQGYGFNPGFEPKPLPVMPTPSSSSIFGLISQVNKGVLKNEQALSEAGRSIQSNPAVQQAQAVAKKLSDISPQLAKQRAFQNAKTAVENIQKGIWNPPASVQLKQTTSNTEFKVPLVAPVTRLGTSLNKGQGQNTNISRGQGYTDRPQVSQPQASGLGKSLVAYEENSYTKSGGKSDYFSEQESQKNVDNYRGTARNVNTEQRYDEDRNRGEPFKSEFDRYYYGNETQRSEIADKLHRTNLDSGTSYITRPGNEGGKSDTYYRGVSETGARNDYVSSSENLGRQEDSYRSKDANYHAPRDERQQAADYKAGVSEDHDRRSSTTHSTNTGYDQRNDFNSRADNFSPRDSQRSASDWESYNTRDRNFENEKSQERNRNDNLYPRDSRNSRQVDSWNQQDGQRDSWNQQDRRGDSWNQQDRRGDSWNQKDRQGDSWNQQDRRKDSWNQQDSGRFKSSERNSPTVFDYGHSGQGSNRASHIDDSSKGFKDDGYSQYKGTRGERERAPERKDDDRRGQYYGSDNREKYDRYSDKGRNERNNEQNYDKGKNVEKFTEESRNTDGKSKDVLYEDFLFGDGKKDKNSRNADRGNSDNKVYGERRSDNRRSSDYYREGDRRDWRDSRDRGHEQGTGPRNDGRLRENQRREGPGSGINDRNLPITDDQKARVDQQLPAVKVGVPISVMPPPVGVPPPSLQVTTGIRFPPPSVGATTGIRVPPPSLQQTTGIHAPTLSVPLSTGIRVPPPSVPLSTGICVPPPSLQATRAIYVPPPSVRVTTPIHVPPPSLQLSTGFRVPPPVAVAPGTMPVNTAIPPPGIVCKDCNVTCLDQNIYNTHLTSDAHILTLQRKAQELFHMESRKSRFDVDSSGNPLKAQILPPSSVIAALPNSTAASSVPSVPGVGRNSEERLPEEDGRKSSPSRLRSRSESGVQVIPPKPLGPLETRSVNGTWLILQWRPRHKDEESLIDKYVVEYRNAREIHWVQVGATVKHEFEVNGLQEGTDYLFRVYTTNKDVKSEYLESVLVTTRRKRDSPDRESRRSSRERERDRGWRSNRERRSSRERDQKIGRVGDRNSRRDRRSSGDRKSSGDRRLSGDRNRRLSGDRRTSGDKKDHGDRKSSGDRKQGGDRDRKASRDRNKDSRNTRENKDSKNVKRSNKDEKQAVKGKSDNESEKAKEENESTVKPPENVDKSETMAVDKAEEEVECLLYKEFPNYDYEPMLGLDNIYEIRSYLPKTPPRYVCKLCNNKGSHKVIVKHIIGFPHKLNYFKKHNPEVYDIINMIAVKKQQVERANYEARREEDGKGRGSVRVLLMLNPQDNNGKVVYKDPLPVKAPPPARRKETGDAPELTDCDYQSQFPAIYNEAMENGSLTDYTLIGLDYIKELLHPKMEKDPKYSCSLCSVLCYDSTILSHLVGKKHRYNYLKAYHESVHDEILNTKGNKHQVLIDRIKEIAEKDGPGTIKTKVARNLRMWRDRASKNQEAAIDVDVEPEEQVKPQEEENLEEPPEDEAEESSESKKSNNGIQAIKFGIKKNDSQPTNVKAINVLEQEQGTPKHKETVDWTKENSLLQSKIHNETIIKSSRKSKFLTVYSEFFKRFPVIGMQWVTEFQKQDVKQEPWYMCFMCQQKLQWKNILDHVTSNLHRLNYMKKSDYRQKYNAVYHAIKKDKQSARPLIEQYSKEIAGIEGPPTEIEVMLELNVNTEAFKSVARIQENVKAHAVGSSSSQPIQISIASTPVSDVQTSSWVSTPSVQPPGTVAPAITQLSSTLSQQQNVVTGLQGGTVPQQYGNQSIVQPVTQSGFQAHLQPPPLRAPPLRPPPIRPPPMAMAPNAMIPPSGIHTQRPSMSIPPPSLQYQNTANAYVSAQHVSSNPAATFNQTSNISATPSIAQMASVPYNISDMRQPVATVSAQRPQMTSTPIQRPPPLLQTPQMGQNLPIRPFATPISVQQPYVHSQSRNDPSTLQSTHTLSVAPQANIEGSQNWVGHPPPPWQRQPGRFQNEPLVGSVPEKTFPHRTEDQPVNRTRRESFPHFDTPWQAQQGSLESDRSNYYENTKNDPYKRSTDFREEKALWEDSVDKRQDPSNNTYRFSPERGRNFSETDRGVKRYDREYEFNDRNKKLRHGDQINIQNSKESDENPQRNSSFGMSSQTSGGRSDTDYGRGGNRDRDPEMERRESAGRKGDNSEKGGSMDSDQKRQNWEKGSRRFESRDRGYTDRINSKDRDNRRSNSRDRDNRRGNSRDRDNRRGNSRERDTRNSDNRDRDHRSNNSRDRDRRRGNSRERDNRIGNNRDRDKRGGNWERDFRRGNSRERVKRRLSEDRDQKRPDNRVKDLRIDESSDRSRRGGSGGLRRRSRSPYRQGRSPTRMRQRDDLHRKRNETDGRESEHSPSPLRKPFMRDNKSGSHTEDRREQSYHSDEHLQTEDYSVPLDESKVDDLVRQYSDRVDEDYSNFMGHDAEFDDFANAGFEENWNDKVDYERRNVNNFNEKGNDWSDLNSRNFQGGRDLANDRHVRDRSDDRNFRYDSNARYQHDDRYPEFSEPDYSRNKRDMDNFHESEEYGLKNRYREPSEEQRLDRTGHYDTYHGSDQYWQDGRNRETEHVQDQPGEFRHADRGMHEEVGRHRDEVEDYGRKDNDRYMHRAYDDRGGYGQDVETDRQFFDYNHDRLYDDQRIQGDNLPDPPREEIDELLRRASTVMVTPPPLHDEFTDYKDGDSQAHISHPEVGAPYQRGGRGRGRGGYRGRGPRSAR